jgi:transcriptional antiterminator RfaH
MTTRWYVVQTHTHSESKAVAHLERQGFEAYLPRYQKRRRHARRVEVVPAVLFPRYLFVSVDMAAQRWRSIHSTIGVSRLVCNGDEPAPVPDGVVAELRRREGANGFVQLERRTFEPGSRVIINDGAFASYLGLFEGMRDDERVTVLLDLLGRKVRVVLDELSIAAA